jgi:hypothetical protein
MQSVHSAVHGLHPSPVPQSAKDAGLLLINNYIGERVNDIGNQTSTLDTKINEIGRLVQKQNQTFENFKSEEQEIVRGIQETATRAYIAALSAESKAQTNSELLSEIKNALKNNKAMEDHVSALLSENEKLKQEVTQLKEKKSGVREEDVRQLRAEHKELNMEVKRLTRKLELYVEHQRGVDGYWAEESDGLMEVLWPQGWESVVPSGGRERGVLADEPGFRRDEKMGGNQAGRKGPSGGWCSVM